MAYGPGGGPETYFYPVRYYAGIVFMIIGVVFCSLGFVLARAIVRRTLLAPERLTV